MTRHQNLSRAESHLNPQGGPMTHPTGDGPDQTVRTRIFVSFRNGDAPLIAAFIAYELAARFGRDAVFRSSESLRTGERFAETIWKHHAASTVVVAVIGPKWLDVKDG